MAISILNSYMAQGATLITYDENGDIVIRDAFIVPLEDVRNDERMAQHIRSAKVGPEITEE